MNFSTSNRFNSFNDDDEEDHNHQDGNLFKTMKTISSSSSNKKTNDQRFKFTSTSFFRQEEEKQKEEFKMESVAFPELSTKTTLTTTISTREKSFLDTLKKEELFTAEITSLSDVNSDWVTITRNKATGKITYKDQKQETITPEQELKKETKLLIKALTNLHIKRTKDYINAWGIEEHRKTFYSTSLFY
jgi:hypothetical protein